MALFRSVRTRWRLPSVVPPQKNFHIEGEIHKAINIKQSQEIHANMRVGLALLVQIKIMKYSVTCCSLIIDWRIFQNTRNVSLPYNVDVLVDNFQIDSNAFSNRFIHFIIPISIILTWFSVTCHRNCTLMYRLSLFIKLKVDVQ